MAQPSPRPSSGQPAPGPAQPPQPPVQPGGPRQPGPAGPGPWQQDYPPAYRPAGPPQNGFGVTGLVTGIVGLVLSWVPGLSLVLGVAAIVFGAIGWRKASQGLATSAGMGIAGLVLGIITVVIGAGLLIAIGMSVPGT